MNAAARAAAIVLAAVASFATMYAVCAWAGAQPAPAVASAILTIALARRSHASGLAALAVGALRLAGVALAAAAVGWLLITVPLAGAVVFVVAMGLSVWLRNFGTRGRVAGAVLALPFVALLVVPFAPAHARGGPAADIALTIAGGLIAFAFVTLAARFTHDDAAEPDARAEAASSERKRRPGMSVPTRMALQMVAALGAAFVVGFTLVPAHVGWTVLTAFIVCSGARGRGDAFYKAVLRLGGAIAGTLVALVLATVWTPHGLAEAVVVFGALYLGLWLRERNYAYWAAAMTLIFALLAHGDGVLTLAAFGARLEAILAGAVCGVAAAWFVTPIRTVSVIRRSLADALLAFDDVVANGHAADPERPMRLARFERRLAELDRVAPPVRWHRRIAGLRAGPDHPAAWLDLAAGLRPHAPGAAERPDRGAIRRAIGVSRRAIASHGAAEPGPDHVPIGVALAKLHETLGNRE